MEADVEIEVDVVVDGPDVKTSRGNYNFYSISDLMLITTEREKFQSICLRIARSISDISFRYSWNSSEQVYLKIYAENSLFHASF